MPYSQAAFTLKNLPFLSSVQLNNNACERQWAFSLFMLKCELSATGKGSRLEVVSLPCTMRNFISSDLWLCFPSSWLAIAFW